MGLASRTERIRLFSIFVVCWSVDLCFGSGVIRLYSR